MLANISPKRKLTVMLAVMSGLLLAALDQTIVATALPRIVSDLNGLQYLSWVVTGYLLTSTITVPISGKLSDIYGRKKLLLIGIIVFVGGSALAGLSQNMWELIATRAFQGIGAGILMSNSIAIIGDLYAPAERAKWQGLLGAVFGLSSVIGPLLGGYLTDNVSWRWNFYINVPVGIVAFALISIFMPQIAAHTRKAIDYLGATLLAGGLASLMLGFVWGGNQYAWTSWQVLNALGVAAILLLAFVIVERKHAEDPILPLDLFKNSTFRLSMIILFFSGMAMFGAILYIPLFAQDVLGSSATNSGIILTPMVAGLVVSSIVSGQIVSRTGRYKILAIGGMLVTTLSIFWLSQMNSSTSHTDLIIRMVVTGLGLGVSMPIFNLIVQNAFGQDRLGVVTASTQLSRSIGSTIGVALMGSILNNQLAHKLGGLGNDAFVQMSSQSGQGINLSGLDSNKIQGLLSPQAQAQITGKLHQLPVAVQGTVLGDFAAFIGKVKDALSSSISEVFLISAALVSISFFAALFLKEVPLRKTHAENPAEEAGIEVSEELGNFDAESEPALVSRGENRAVDRREAIDGIRRAQ